MSIFTEVEDIYTTLSNFNESDGQYLLSGGVPPNPNSLAPNFTYSELMTLCLTSIDEQANYVIGVSQDVIAEGAANLREIDISTLTKTAIYTNRISEAEDDVEFLDKTKNFILGILRGGNTNGSQS